MNAKAETKQNMEGNLFKEPVRVRTIKLGDSNEKGKESGGKKKKARLKSEAMEG